MFDIDKILANLNSSGVEVPQCLTEQQLRTWLKEKRIERRKQRLSTPENNKN